MTGTKISTSVLAMYFQILYDFTEHYHQVAGEKVINDQNFEFFVSDHLNQSDGGLIIGL